MTGSATAMSLKAEALRTCSATALSRAMALSGLALASTLTGRVAAPCAQAGVDAVASGVLEDGVMIGEAGEAFDEEQQQAVEDEDNEENDEKFRQLVLDNGDEVVFPVTLDDPDDVGRLILRGHGQKVHDYHVSLSGML